MRSDLVPEGFPSDGIYPTLFTRRMLSLAVADRKQCNIRALYLARLQLIYPSPARTRVTDSDYSFTAHGFQLIQNYMG